MSEPEGDHGESLTSLDLFKDMDVSKIGDAVKSFNKIADSISLESLEPLTGISKNLESEGVKFTDFLSGEKDLHDTESFKKAESSGPEMLRIIKSIFSPEGPASILLGAKHGETISSLFEKFDKAEKTDKKDEAEETDEAEEADKKDETKKAE